MNNADRRVVRTRKLLSQALIELTSQKAFEQITIRELTDHADIGYATFFRHYDGLDDLMLEVFTNIVEELESLPDQHGEDYFEQEGRFLFKHIAENKALYSSILDSHTFSRRLRQHIMNMVYGHMSQHKDQLDGLAFPLEAAAQHMASSLLGMIDWWLLQEEPYAIDQMVLIYERLIVQATWYALNKENKMPLPW